MKSELGRLHGEQHAERRQQIEAKVAALEIEIKGWLQKIPEQWEAEQSTFQALQKTERDARTKYRQAADDAYKSVGEVLSILNSTEVLRSLGGNLHTLTSNVVENEPADMVDAVVAMSKRVSRVDGAKYIKSHLSKARSGGGLRGTVSVARQGDIIVAGRARKLRVRNSRHHWRTPAARAAT